MDEGLPPPPPYTLHDTSSRPPVSTSAATNGHVHVSAAAYFEMRPPTRPKPVPQLPVRIAVLPSATATDLPMPEPKSILTSRDVDLHDWTAFVNHLVPQESPVSAICIEEKPKKGIKWGKAQTGKTVASSAPPELERQQSIKTVVDEWNQGFFMPRGLEIVVQVAVTPPLRALLVQT